eukprot:CAMPEP_0173361440 /NCGR_PEP_ID=MMETSP1144-20121109/21202_1 /TAXON_ID=483371 /ORGANISM="non described non described, Strain CCMP2298" /LENGTH=97 /DNA_ID=CAMNT_0014311021 /DNA_START=38 /DNA_END=327 /DNA_ORIENTATION=-
MWAAARGVNLGGIRYGDKEGDEGTEDTGSRESIGGRGGRGTRMEMCEGYGVMEAEVEAEAAAEAEAETEAEAEGNATPAWLRYLPRLPSRPYSTGLG